MNPAARPWTAERIAKLSAQDIKQLRANAERLHEAELVALCGQALESARAAHVGPRPKTSRTHARKLVARTSAFQARGVWLEDPKSWGGVRKSDGTIVLALWADHVVWSQGECTYLLWRPSTGGARPWSDTPAGKERLAHCRRAMDAGGAEGLLVYGQSLHDCLPEERAHTVYGVDPDTVLAFKVELRGEDYWAVWGKSAAALRLSSSLRGEAL
jgi:hypothetical protein